MDSRSVDFAGEIMRMTDGEGVDLVLNSLTGAAIPKSLELLRGGGRFLEIGKAEIWDEKRVAEINSKAAYHAIDLAQLIQSDPAALRRMFDRLVAEIADGALRPPPISTFAFHDAASAFRYMAQARHIGKIVLVHDSTLRARIKSDATYLITGGLTGLGLLTAEWLVERGARHLMLVGRRPPPALTAETLSRLQAAGAEIRTIKCDVTVEAEIAAVFREIECAMPPLRGVVHSAGILDDGVLLQQDWERFRRVMAPKVEGAWNLHQLTQNMPAGFFRLVFFDLGDFRRVGAGESRRRQRLHGRAGASSPRAGPAGDEHQLGSVVGGRGGCGAERRGARDGARHRRFLAGAGSPRARRSAGPWPDADGGHGGRLAQVSRQRKIGAPAPFLFRRGGRGGVEKGSRPSAAERRRRAAATGEQPAEKKVLAAHGLRAPAGG